MFENLNIAWASILVEELIRNGVDYFCVSPGSRSSPLAIAVARNKNARSIICYDERGSSFHALGYARAKGRPAAVITTSGTAVANCFPTVIEASMDHVPLIILTADRPVELQDVKANQTIDQQNIFGRYVRYFFNLPCPETSIPPQMILTTIDHAVFRSMSPPKGPVHINCMFREPLSPEKRSFPDDYLIPIKDWLLSNRPYTEYHIPKPLIEDEEIKEISKIINDAENGLLILGRIDAKEKEKVLKLLEKIDWPIFSDIRSNIWTEKRISHFPLILSSIEDISFDIVLHIGETVVSKHLIQLLERTKPFYIVVKEHPFRQDPSHLSGMQIQADIGDFCEKIAPYLDTKKSRSYDLLKEISFKTERMLKEIFEKNGINEASLAYWISKYIPEKSGLFLSNSMPIRDMDMFGNIRKDVIVEANRGASGIDGIIATSTGFASGLKRPVTLIIGDIAFIHDLNSLFILKKLNLPLVIILINNNGGGIFSFLPISGFPDLFEKYFVTPHNISSFKEIIESFGIRYLLIKDRDELLDAYRDSIKREDTSILEVRIERKKNKAFHMHIQKMIRLLK